MAQLQEWRSAHREYTADTTTFLLWLRETAKACGYKSTSEPALEPLQDTVAASTPSARLKGKDRKLAKQAAAKGGAVNQVALKKYKVSHLEIWRQAEAIAASSLPLAKVPAGIFFVAKRAISLRYSFLVRHAARNPDNPSNERHAFFRSLLDKCLGLLSSKASVSEEPRSMPALSELCRNRFENLDLEETVEETQVAISEEASLPSRASTIATKDAGFVYDFEDVNPEDELAFALHCFFEDLHAIQRKIQHTWQRVKNEDISVAVATIITNVGLDIVKRLEQEILEVLPASVPDRDYHGISGPLLLAEAQSRGDGLRDLWRYRYGLKEGSFDDFLYIAAADTLQKFADTNQRWYNSKLRWPPGPCQPLEYNYIGDSGLYHRPDIQARIQEDVVLTQMLYDALLLRDKAVYHYSVMTGSSRIDYRHDLPIIHDELFRCVTSLLESGSLMTHTVFTAQIALDISHICGRGDQSLPRAALREASQHAGLVFPHKMNAEGEIDDLDIAWISDDEQAGLAIYKLASDQFTKPPIEAMKKYFLDDLATVKPWESMTHRLQGLLHDQIRRHGLDSDNLSEKDAWMASISLTTQSDDPDFQLKHNALFAGSTIIELIMALEAGGLCIANTHMTIFTAAHLYNALHKLGLTDLHWPDMERVVDVHTGAIFANNIPETSEDILRRLEYRTGLSTALRNSNVRGKKGKKAKEEHDAYFLKPSTASIALRETLEKQKSIEHTMLLLENQLENRSMQPYHARTSLAKSRSRKQQHSATQLLARLEQYLPEILKDMEIDYITLTKTCNALMEAVEKALEEKHSLKIPELPELTSEGLHVKKAEYMALLRQVFKFNCDAQETHRKQKNQEPFRGGEHLQTTTRVFEAFYNQQIRGQLPSTRENS